MAVIEWIRFFAGTVFLLLGLGIFIIEMAGVFRFKYVLNRMHAAAMGDTLGIGASLIGLMIMSGFNFVTLKLFLIILFLWFSSPVSSHLIARLEVTTNEELTEQCQIISLEKLEAERASKAEEGAEEK
ncbi:MAG: monovalent cation/H(+) antiporter subunit G [Lachnospiraceae bacterium]|nr:monovalent cation/H(+) antiporter subunit G [Lachnospiraceae bacterium]